LATHKPTQEKIKRPTAQKMNFCHRTSGTFGFALPTSRPFCKAKRATFSLRTKDSTEKTNALCRIPTQIFFSKSLAIIKLCLLL